MPGNDPVNPGIRHGCGCSACQTQAECRYIELDGAVVVAHADVGWMGIGPKAAARLNRTS